MDDTPRVRRNVRRSPSPARMDVDAPEERSRTLDPDLPQNSRGELKIKGQATTSRRSKWDDRAAHEVGFLSISIYLCDSDAYRY